MRLGPWVFLVGLILAMALPACAPTGISCAVLDHQCICRDNVAENMVACTPVTVSGGVCCATNGWPGPDDGCECQTLACRMPGFGTGEDCSCQAGADPITATLTSCTFAGPICCYDHDLFSCYCGHSTCRVGETQTATCDIAMLGPLCESSFPIPVTSCAR